MGRTRPPPPAPSPATSSATRSGRRGSFRSRAIRLAVPVGSSASGTRVVSRRPFSTSLRVPSPPATTSRSTPASSVRARAPASPGPVVQWSSTLARRAASASTSRCTRLDPWRPPEIGFAITKAFTIAPLAS